MFTAAHNARDDQNGGTGTLRTNAQQRTKMTVHGVHGVHGVYRAALNGELERGTGGFVYVRGDECAYMFPRELVGQANVAGTLTEMLADTDTAATVFYVVENRDSQLHVLAYPREAVMKDMLTSASTESSTAGAENAE